MTGVEAVAPMMRRVRAYFAPVDRATGHATIFDPAQAGRFDVDAPPAPWVDLGWVRGFERECATKIEPVRSGAPAVTQSQVRSEVEATVALVFESWGKLQIALSAGTQEMNLLRTSSGAEAAGSGGAAAAAVAVLSGSTASVLNVGAAASSFAAGDLVAVDLDYAGETGYLGSGVSGAYTRVALSDVDYMRRITLNVGRVASVSDTAITLEGDLPAGVPASGARASVVEGFCDREGSSFFQEWSAVFVMDGQQGERLLLHYPRLQAMSGARESAEPSGGLETVRLKAAFRALPVQDAVDGQQVLCFRSFLPA